VTFEGIPFDIRRVSALAATALQLAAAQKLIGSARHNPQYPHLVMVRMTLSDSGCGILRLLLTIATCGLAAVEAATSKRDW